MKKIKLRRIKILHAKKAQYFMPLFAFFVLVLFTMLYFDLAAKTEQFESKEGENNKIGEKQLAVLNAVAEGEKALLYLDLSAQQAYGAAVLETAKSNYLDYSSCSFYRGVPVVYGSDDCMLYGNELEEEVEKKLTDEITLALAPYIEAYTSADLPTEKYILIFEKGVITGRSVYPLLIPILSITSQKITEEAKSVTQQGATVSDLIDIWPVDYPERYITSCFGYREIEEGSTYHEGVDIRAKGHVSVYSVLPGTVTTAALNKKGMVVIDHGNGISTIYLHLDTIVVSEGQKVDKKTILGTSGATGTKAEHLHFEIINKNIQQVTDQYGYKGVLANEKEGKVNPLCFFSSSLTYEYNSIKTKNCVANGGYKRFCDLYNQQTGVSISSSTSGSSYTPSASTTEKLKQIDTNYGALIDSAVSGTSVPKALVVAVIMTESGGNTNAVSSTGCAGLMQFCKGTAYNYDLCSNKKCTGTDYRTDATRAIPAGVKLLQDNLNSFSGYTDRVAFSLAAYNGGAGLIKKAITATGKSDPSWDEVSAQITQELVADVYSDAFSDSVYEQSFGTTEMRNKKVREVRGYANKVLSYYYAYEGLEK